MGIFGDIIGKVKDKASLGKAALLSPPSTASLHRAILKATTHDPALLPHPHHLETLLAAGDGPRSAASAVIHSLMGRLHRTASSAVALKCLLALHVIVRRGTFILHDQLSVYPATGGRNYLKLSNFRDQSSPATWDLSTWIRWYAKYLEQILSASRTLGYFLYSTSCSLEREKAKEIIASLLCKDLLKELDSLVTVIEEIGRSPENFNVKGNKLVFQLMNLVGEDYLTTIDEILIRFDEFKERLGCLSFGDSVELVCAVKRLEDCREKVAALFDGKVAAAAAEELWVVLGELKEKVGEAKGFKEERMVVGWGRFESDRFGDRVVKQGDSVKFASNRFAFQFAYGEVVR